MSRAKPVDRGWREVDMSSTSAPTGYVHPTFVMAHIVNPVLKFIGSPTLTVRGRRSGLPITTPLAPFDFEGARYLVGGGGETQWVRNLRAAGEGQLRMGGKHQDFRTVEIQGPERDRIVTAYRTSMGRRFERHFKALPNPADHPVFRIEPMGRD
jgi:deazaflavin-dependent oxidoreductase (nitroreductase family)